MASTLTLRITSCTALLLLCSCAQRCAPVSQSPCEPACPASFTCDEAINLCVSSTLPFYEGGEVPGRASRLTASGARAQAAVIDPARRLVLVSTRENVERVWRWRVLSTSLRAGTSHLAMTSSRTLTVLAWIDQEGSYRLATQRAPQGDTIERAWSIETVGVVRGVDATPLPYDASDDFDVLLVDDDPVLVFRDRARGELTLLRRGEDTAPNWTATLIDDGADEDFVKACEARGGRGVGVEPDLIALRSGQLAVAYHDADCGDLRLARQGAERRWQVRVLDQGDSEPVDEHTTGRWPSLRQHPRTGNIAISYFDETRGRLMFGQLDNELFTRQVVDDGEQLRTLGQRTRGSAGAFSKLSFVDEDSLIISYFDGYDLDARLATGTPSDQSDSPASTGLTWESRRLTDDGIAGLFIDHVVLEDQDTVLFIMENLFATTPTDDSSPGHLSTVRIVEQDRSR